MDMAARNPCGVLIKQLHDTLEQESNNALRSQGLTMAQVMALMHLHELGDRDVPLKELEKLLHVAQSTTAGIVVRLERKGLVMRRESAEDKRIKIIRITEAGQRCCQTAEARMKDAENRLLSGLTSAEREIFNVLLQKVSDNMK